MSNKLHAFVQYSTDDKMIPGSLIYRSKMPKAGEWIEVPLRLCCDTSDADLPTFWRTPGLLKAWIKYDKKGIVVAGSNVARANKPKNGTWVEIPYRKCCLYTTTTTTTTTSTSTTTTTSSTTTTTTTIA